MKKLFSLFSSLIIGSFAFGQFTPPVPYNPVFIPNYYYGNNSSDISYRLKVTFKDGQSDTIISKFHTTKDPFRVYIQTKDGVRIYPNETMSILARKKNLTGIPYDSLWLFAVYTGKLTAYYYIPDTMTNTYSYIQKGTGSLEKYSKQKFKSMISDNERALKIYNYKTILPRVGVGLFAAAGAMFVIVGLNGGNNDPVVITGVVMAAVGIPLIAMGQNRIRKTIKIYNE